MTPKQILGFDRLNEEGVTIVMITHDEAIAQMSDRIIRIEDGNIVKGGD